MDISIRILLSKLLISTLWMIPKHYQKHFCNNGHFSNYIQLSISKGPKFAHPKLLEFHPVISWVCLLSIFYRPSSSSHKINWMIARMHFNVWYFREFSSSDTKRIFQGGTNLLYILQTYSATFVDQLLP